MKALKKISEESDHSKERRFAILKHLYKNRNGVEHGELAKKLGVDEHKITKLMKQLQSAKLARTQVALSNRIAHITDKASNAFDNHKPKNYDDLLSKIPQ